MTPLPKIATVLMGESTMALRFDNGEHLSLRSFIGRTTARIYLGLHPNDTFADWLKANPHVPVTYTKTGRLPEKGPI